MSYTYHIAFTGTAYTEIIPSEEPRITFQETAGELFLQPVIEEIKIGGLLNASAYAILVADFFDPTKFGNQLKIRIDRNGVEAFNFRTSISNTKIDTEKKTFMVAPEPDDEYQDVLDKYEVEYDIGALLNQSVNPYILATNAFVNVDFTTFSDVSRTVTYTNTTGAVKTARLAFTSASLGLGDKVKVVIRNLTYTNEPPWINVANSIFGDISNVEQLSVDGMYTLILTAGVVAYIELTQDAAGGDGTGSFDYEVYYYTNTVNTNSKLLNILIDQILGAGYMASGATMRSTFLFNDALPPEAPASISAYITANPTHNYVTSAVNRLNLLYLCKADGLTTDKADDYKTTFKKLMEVLKQKLRAYWYIDTEGYFRIEHEQYFRQMDVQIDITTATYLKYKPEIDMLLYSYDKSDSYSRLQYSENNANGADFIADPIIYDYIKTSTKKKDINVDISTDVSWIVTNPGDATSDGFILAETETLGFNVPVFGASRTAGYYFQNQYLSWYSIIPLFFKYFGEANTANVNNGGVLTLTHVKELLRQGGIKFYHNGILTFYNPVTLTIGNAYIKKIELDLSSGFYTLEVGYDPYNI